MGWYLTWQILLICGWLSAVVSGAARFGGALLLLPVLTHPVGAREAVPILTVAKLLGSSLVLGSWTGRRGISVLQDHAIGLAVEVLPITSTLMLLSGYRQRALGCSAVCSSSPSQ